MFGHTSMIGRDTFWKMWCQMMWSLDNMKEDICTNSDGGGQSHSLDEIKGYIRRKMCCPLPMCVIK